MNEHLKAIVAKTPKLEDVFATGNKKAIALLAEPLKTLASQLYLNLQANRADFVAKLGLLATTTPEGPTKEMCPTVWFTHTELYRYWFHKQGMPLRPEGNTADYEAFWNKHGKDFFYTSAMISFAFSRVPFSELPALRDEARRDRLFEECVRRHRLGRDAQRQSVGERFLIAYAAKLKAMGLAYQAETNFFDGYFALQSQLHRLLLEAGYLDLTIKTIYPLVTDKAQQAQLKATHRWNAIELTYARKVQGAYEYANIYLNGSTLMAMQSWFTTQRVLQKLKTASPTVPLPPASS